MKGEKIDDMEICDDETDTAPTVVTDLPSLGEVQQNDEPVKALDTSSDAESQHTTKTADAGEQEIEETSIIASQFPIQEHENADNANIHVEESDVEVEATEIPDSVSQTEDQAVKEIHETGTSLNVIDGDTKEIENQIREVPEVLLVPTNQHADAARDDEITPTQTPQDEKTEEQLQVPSSGLLSEEQESETTTRIGKGSTNEDAMEEAKMRQAEVSMIREELETTSEVEGIENQVQGEENRVQDLSTISCAEELDAESSKDNSIITKMSAQEDEGQRELEVSNLELKIQKDSQDISPDKENTGLEKRSTDAPSQYEEIPVQQSSQEASTDEDIVYSKNSNKDADNLPTPYPTVTKHSTEDIGGKNEEASNLEFEKNGEVLLESMSAINSPSVPLTSEGIEVIEETPKDTTELGDGENHCEETTEEEAIEKYTSTEKISEEMQGFRNFDQISLQEKTATKTNQEDELRAEDYPGERTNTIFDASRNEIQHEMVFKESEEDSVDKNMEGVVRADDKGPHQVSALDEIANQSELGSHRDETDFTDTATEATAQVEELKSSEAMLVSHEVERAGDNDEETAISKDWKLQNTDLVVPSVSDTAAEEALDGKELETLDDFSERDLDPNHGNIEPYEHKKEIATAGTIDSESLVDNEKLRHTFPEPGCDGSGGTEDLDLTKKDGSNEPSISSTTATSQETLADEESEKAVDTKQHHFMSDEPTAEPESIPEEGNGFQLEAHTMVKEPVVSVMADEAKLDENKIRTTTAIEEEETPQENEKPNVLPHIMDSETEVSHEAVTMNISDDIQGPEKTSLAIPHEQITSKTDPSESIERTNSKGMECGEENCRMGEQSKEITEESQMIESAKISLSHLLQRSAKQNVQVGEDVTEERELMGNKEELQNETAETVEAEEEEAVHDKKDEEEEGDELKREDSGSDAPIMVEASRDMDVKIAHKKPHHHNILSGVGSRSSIH